MMVSAWTVSLMTLLLAGIHLSLQFCTDAQGFHTHGSYWPCPKPSTRICECGPAGQIIYHDNNGHGTGHYDVHYKAFDGMTFDYQGVCRYLLVRDCCENTFSIAVQQEPYLYQNSPISISEAFTIRFGNYVIELTKKPSKLEIKTIQPPTAFDTFHVDNADVYAEMQSGRIFIALKKLKVWFRWDFNWIFSVWVAPKYRGKTCGILGDFNGDPYNDLRLSLTGDPVTVTHDKRQYGIGMRTLIQPTRCANGHNPQHARRKRDLRQRLASIGHRALCTRFIRGPIFDACRTKRALENVFIDNCVTELDACKMYGVTGCLAFGLGTYIEECKNNGYNVSGEWKEQYNCSDCVYKGVTYGHRVYWTDGCYTYQCLDGRLRLAIGHCCSWIGGEKVRAGGVRFYGCYRYACIGSTWRRRRMPCCYHRGTRRYYVVGSRWSCRDRATRCCLCRAHGRITECRRA